jgi:hypothetical protein
MEKLIKDNNVAVIFSPGFGAGWYTWNHVEYRHELVFDPMLVELITSNKKDEFYTYVAMRYPDAYVSGFDDLAIRWIPVGTKFRITEYDGNESIELENEIDWFVA